jgi:hypothetical protein
MMEGDDQTSEPLKLGVPNVMEGLECLFDQFVRQLEFQS